MSGTATTSHGAGGQRSDCGFSVTSYDLGLDYRVATNRLDAVAVVAARATRALSKVNLDLAGLRVSEVLIDGRRPARWRHRDGILAIRLAGDLGSGEAFSVTVRYSGMPGPIAGPWGDVGWEELADGALVAGQPDGAPSWFPCHDSPSDKATFRIAVTVESVYAVICNGWLVSCTPRSGTRRWVYEMPQPMAPYLATVQVGRYESVAVASTPVEQVVVAPPSLRDAVGRDLACQPRMMEFFAETFGPYPFVSYTVVVTEDELEIPLEAQGMSVFGSNHLDGTGAWERLVAHELAHQWFGNSLTAGRWQDIWLHEGFACYAEWLWSEASGAATAHALALAAHGTLADLDQDFLIGSPDDDHMFDDRLYKRGALTLHALRLAVGDADFFAVMRRWADENRYGTVTTPGFIATAQAVVGRPLGDLFAAWLAQEALPTLPEGGTST